MINPRVRSTHVARLAVACLAALIGLAACDSGDGGGSRDVTGDTPAGFTAPDSGDALPAVTIQQCDGTAVALRDWVAGFDVVYLTFGAKWCSNCAKEAPIINSKVVQRFAGAKVGVVQVLIEEEPDNPPTLALCTAWGTDIGAEFPIMVDLDQGMVPQHFGPAVGGTLPVHLIITGDGIIRFRKVGDIPADIGDRVSDWLPTSS